MSKMLGGGKAKTPAKKGTPSGAKQLTISSFFTRAPSASSPAPASASNDSSKKLLPQPNPSLVSKPAAPSLVPSPKDLGEKNPTPKRKRVEVENVDSDEEVVALDDNEETRLSQPKSAKSDVDRPVSRRRTTISSDVEGDSDGDRLSPVPTPPPRRPNSRRHAIVLGSDDEMPDADPAGSPNPPTSPRSERPSASVAERFAYKKDAAVASLPGIQSYADPNADAKKQKLRERFMQRFGTTSRSERGASDEESGSDDDGPAKKKRRAASPVRKGAASKKSKYTPLEQRVLEIKAENPDCLLLVEVGYKYRFFGDDAEIAAKELHIVAHLDHNMQTASIPVQRLHVHVAKLVQLGYKVGVVRQMETAALKAVGDNKTAPFVRELSQVYTKGTFIDDIGGGDDNSQIRSSYIVFINEEPMKSSEEKAKISVVVCFIVPISLLGTSSVERLLILTYFWIKAVLLSTGDVLYDEFEDGFLRNELETRLLHTMPTEIIVPEESMSEPTEKLVQKFADRGCASDDTIRIERLRDGFLNYAGSQLALSEYYENSGGREQEDAERDDVDEDNDSRKPKSNGGSKSKGSKGLAELHRAALALPKAIVVCLAAVLKYLTQFNLEHVLRLMKFFAPFSTIGHMILNATTLNSLEIFRNETDYEEKGSLFWVLDHTHTKFGQRLLRKWVGRPLIRIE
ncbi:hypothetical protein BDK51DRAFT_51553 [Blyttiomyces helicus]|uniref:DNA mismatch repair protein MSH3 n=1 Tax=Blyttiomyces helicus TaxID=388810 RepID=A0A4P9WBZ7_9FUNG|nr:hypothetical protein BDK51DRAFT_51553 [Blyttiomyces helicus]|eukprot:RKO87846.1 hypothetical protein BDK51DRAFT_51553 [Blyttiomyces helicus]